jgi:DMSO reductase family type II enzyme heme b subunit
LNLRAASDGEKLYLRLRWSDTSQDIATSREQFSDGAAVQFALGGGPSTSYMMGATTTPVNIWYWKAGSDEAQNLAAGGFGSTTRLDKGQLSASSVYRDGGEWVVVFSRPLTQMGEHQIDLTQDSLSIALALWQGDAKQRDGLKHTSPGWITLQ